MKAHTKIYIKALGYDLIDFMPCEITGQKGVDIHHIESRGMGGSKNKDRIENLMLLTREAHLKYGDVPKYMVYLFQTHKYFLDRNGVSYNKKYLDQKIKFYKSLQN